MKHADDPCKLNLHQNFKNNSLLSHESEVNKLQEEGDRLIELKHPASANIQVPVLCPRDVVVWSQSEELLLKLVCVTVPGSERFGAE